MDLAQANVEIARRAFGGHTGLEFMQDNALDVPSSSADFDVVVNVESSHNYPDFDQFASRVKAAELSDEEVQWFCDDYDKQRQLAQLNRILLLRGSGWASQARGLLNILNRSSSRMSTLWPKAKLHCEQ